MLYHCCLHHLCYSDRIDIVRAADSASWDKMICITNKTHAAELIQAFLLLLQIFLCLTWSVKLLMKKRITAIFESDNCTARSNSIIFTKYLQNSISSYANDGKSSSKWDTETIRSDAEMKLEHKTMRLTLREISSLIRMKKTVESYECRSKNSRASSSDKKLVRQHWLCIKTDWAAKKQKLIHTERHVLW